jgi:hypothetical protein
MNRVLLLPVLALALTASANTCEAQEGLLARLNASPLPTLPGTPTASPLGLLAPRLSNAVSIFQLGGLSNQAGRLAALGVLSPRISPVAGLLSARSLTPQARRMYGLTILSPRATAVVGMFQAARTAAAGGLRGAAAGGRGLAGGIR